MRKEINFNSPFLVTRTRMLLDCAEEERHADSLGWQEREKCAADQSRVRKRRHPPMRRERAWPRRSFVAIIFTSIPPPLPPSLPHLVVCCSCNRASDLHLFQHSSRRLRPWVHRRCWPTASDHAHLPSSGPSLNRSASPICSVVRISRAWPPPPSAASGQLARPLQLRAPLHLLHASPFSIG